MEDRLSIYIVENEAIARASLEYVVTEMGYNLSGSAADADIALGEIKNAPPHILLLDINLGGEKDGIWIAQEILKANLNISIIYLTAYNDKKTLEKVKETKPKAYLKKPYDESTLCTTIDLIAAQIKSPTSEVNGSNSADSYIVVKDGKKKIKLSLSQLKYVQSDGNYVRLGLTDATFFIRGSLKWYLTELPEKQFCQIHRSTMINLDHISMLDSDLVTLGDISFKVGGSYKNRLADQL